MSKTNYTPARGVLVTGAAGFIGSTFTPLIMERYPNLPVIALDSLTYAGSRNNLAGFEESQESRPGASEFHALDITDADSLRKLFASQTIDTVINFAAETHVDRSLDRPDEFFHTNLTGAVTLINIAREFSVRRFLQISTDEVYGSTPEGEEFSEESGYNPSSPYAASKAAADLAILSYAKSYGFPAVIVRGSNNYGPRQYPEKVIPFFVSRALAGKTLPVYGDGKHERDWIHTTDFCRGILCALENGVDGEIYNIAGGNRINNLELVERLSQLLQQEGVPATEIEFVSDRPAHDRRYRVNSAKISRLGWSAKKNFSEGLAQTVNWYLQNHERLRLQIAGDKTLNCR